MTSLYNLRSTPDGNYAITKFDSDYNPEGVYALSLRECSCPAGAKPTCRHRKMLPLFLEHKHVDDGWFLDWDTRLWRKPFGEAEVKATSVPGAIPTEGDLQSNEAAEFGATHLHDESKPLREDGLAGSLTPEPPTREVEAAAPPSQSSPSVGGSLIKRRRIT